MHCAAINNHTDIVEYIVKDLQMKELDRRDQVTSPSTRTHPSPHLT